MQILKTQRYLNELEEILDFIAQDSLTKALNFFDELNEKILLLPQSPYKHRQSLKSDNKNVRDLVFKGYVIPYRVNFSKNQIEILGIFSSNLWDI